MPNSFPIHSVDSQMQASLLVTQVGAMGPNLHWYLTMQDGSLFSGEFEDLELAAERLQSGGDR